jgi:hypothetical protein
MRQLQEGGQDPEPVLMAIEEARLRAELLHVQGGLVRKVAEINSSYHWGH